MRKKKIFGMGLAMMVFLASIAGCNTKENADEVISQKENPTESLVTVAPTDQAQEQDQAQGFPSESPAKPTAEPVKPTSTPIPEQSKDQSVDTQTDQSEEKDYFEIYSEILDKLLQVCSEGYEYEDDIVGQNWVHELLIPFQGEEAKRRIGYAIKDISGDGVPELLIAENDGWISSEKKAKEISALYTIENGKPKFVLEGWSRNRYSVLEDGTIYNRGSNGASYAVMGFYELTQDATALVCRDFYFTYETDETFAKIGIYHNTSGIWDKAVSEELTGAEEDFWDMMQKAEQEIQWFELTSLIDYQYNKRAEELSSPVSIHWAEDVIGDKPYDEFFTDESEWQSSLAFLAKQKVTDFKVYAISLQDVDADGKAIFSEEELYQQAELAPGRAFVLHMTLWGDMPSYGISFVEEEGTVRHFAIMDSGYDGSLLMIEY